MTPGDLPDWGQVRLPDERRLPSTKQLVTSNRKSSAKDGKGWSKASPNGPLPWLHRIHKPSAGITGRCLAEKVYLPTIVSGRVLWHLGYTEEASAAAFTQSYGAFQQAALQQEPSYRVRGILTDGFDSTTSSLRTLFPE